MTHALLLLASLASAQVEVSTPSVNAEYQRMLDDHETSINALTSGRSTFTAASIYRSTPTFIYGIRFGDGTIQVTSPTATAFGSSTFSIVSLAGGVFTNGQLGPCLSGSTVSVTLTTYPIDVIFSGSVGYNSTHESALSFLVDGTFVAPLSTGTPVITPSPLSTQCQSASFRYRLTGLSAASHTFCLTGANNTGAASLTVLGTSTKCPYESNWANASQFGVQEVR